MSKPKKPPTDAEVRRVVERWAAAKGIAAPGLTVSTWDEYGTGDDVLQVRRVPPPEPLAPAERRERDRNHAQLEADQARREFVRWWGEFVAAVFDLDMQCQAIITGPRFDALRRAGIDVDRFQAVWRDLHAIDNAIANPPFTSPLHLNKPYGLMDTAAELVKVEAELRKLEGTDGAR